MKCDEYFIETVLEMTPGSTLNCQTFEFTVHRYEDCWVVLLDDPAPGACLGRELANESELRKFLGGDINSGKEVVAPRLTD